MINKEICEEYQQKGWTRIPSYLEIGEPDRFDLPTGEITLFIEDELREEKPYEPTLRKGKTLLVDAKRALFLDTQVKPVWSHDLKQGYEANGLEIILFQPRRIVAVKTLA